MPLTHRTAFGLRPQHLEDLDSPSPGLTLTVRTGALIRVLAGIALTLSLASLTIELVAARYSAFPLRNLLLPLLRLGDESNLPSAFSTVLLWLAAALLGLIWHARHQLQAPFASTWLLLSGLFVFLAVDEQALLHERTVTGLRRLLGESGGGALHYAWVVPYGVLVLVVLLLTLRFVLQLPAATRSGFLLAGAVYVGGALGLELVEGAVVTGAAGEESLTNLLLVILEETMEMFGILLFIRTLLAYLGRELPPLVLTTEHP